MKKSLSLILAAIVVLSTLALTACSVQTAKAESLMEIDENFAGHRSITVKYPLDAHIDELTDTLLSSNPLKDSTSSTFEYLGVAQDGYTFVMDIVFSSHEDYISQVSALLGRHVTSYVSQPDSVLTSGTRMVEDFDVSELIAWMSNVSLQNEDTKAIEYDCTVNTVSIDGTVFNTSSTIDINERKGKPINSIVIETTNLKDGTYDRTVTFSIPNDTYLELTGSIEQYFATNTSEKAQYCDFTSQGTAWEYKVIFKSLTIEEMAEYTAMLLDTDEDTLFYGDKDNSSTPLSEGLLFEESFDTFSFMNSDGESVQLQYKYALPTKTTHGDGTVFYDGKWNTIGAWQDGIYSVSVDTDTFDIRIPDGIQYAINGIDTTLEVVDVDNFIRTTDFLYSKTQGMDGMLYAKDFFEQRGATVVTDEDDDNLICSVVCQGSSAQITDELTQYFGSGNFMAYTTKDTAFSLSQKTQLTDYVNLSYMLNSTNANRPITYTVVSSSDENIKDLGSDSGDSVKDSDDTDMLTVNVDGGQGTVVYNGKIPNTKNIIIFSIVSLLIVLGVVSVVVYIVYRRHKSRLSPQPDLHHSEAENTLETAPLSDEEDKQYRDEIDKDISEKIEADRIENLSKELKQKEIEQLQKMVYGDADDTIDTQEEQDT